MGDQVGKQGGELGARIMARDEVLGCAESIQTILRQRGGKDMDLLDLKVALEKPNEGQHIIAAIREVKSRRR